MEMHDAQHPRHPDPAPSQETATGADPAFAAALATARAVLSSASVPGPVPVDELELDAMANLAHHEHPCTRELQRSFGRPGTKRTMVWMNAKLAELLVELGCCGVAAGDETWADPYRFPWHCTSGHDAAMVAAALAGRIRNVNSRAHYVARLRAILRQCRAQGLIDAARLAQCLEALPTPKGDAPPAGRALGRKEIEKLFATAAAQPDPWMAARDCAMLAVFFTTGMRACELCDLELCDLDWAELRLSVQNKGRKEVGQAYVTETTVEYLKVWLTWRGGRPGPLFVTVHGNRFTTMTINQRLSTLAKKAGIAHLSSHDPRRTVATTLLRTTDLPTVMKIMRHKQPSTTARYDRSPERHVKRAVRTIKLPPVGDGPNGDDPRA